MMIVAIFGSPDRASAILMLKGHAVDTQATQVCSQGWIGEAASQGPVDDDAGPIGRRP